MNGVDLKITPIESAICVVVIDLAFAVGIFRALNREGDTAGVAKFEAGVLLVGVERAMLI